MVCRGGSYAPYADKGRFIILAPESPGQSWGTGPKNWGYNYLAINRALQDAFARCAIDPSRIALGGFSDGASYALSLGLANGDVFSYVIAFSPGYIVRAQARGRSGPRVWKYRWYILPTANQIMSCQLPRRVASL